MKLRGVPTITLKNLVRLSLQVVLMVSVIGSSWAVGQIESTKSKQVAAFSGQSPELVFSLDCIPSVSLTDLLFNPSLVSRLFLEFSSDISSKAVSNCIAFFVNGYARNPFYTFISTHAP
jgi:hypothetical protein